MFRLKTIILRHRIILDQLSVKDVTAASHPSLSGFTVSGSPLLYHHATHGMLCRWFDSSYTKLFTSEHRFDIGHEEPGNGEHFHLPTPTFRPLDNPEKPNQHWSGTPETPAHGEARIARIEDLRCSKENTTKVRLDGLRWFSLNVPALIPAQRKGTQLKLARLEKIDASTEKRLPSVSIWELHGLKSSTIPTACREIHFISWSCG